jgi:hypothetical protein
MNSASLCSLEGRTITLVFLGYYSDLIKCFKIPALYSQLLTFLEKAKDCSNVVFTWITFLGDSDQEEGMIEARDAASSRQFTATQRVPLAAMRGSFSPRRKPDWHNIDVV